MKGRKRSLPTGTFPIKKCYFFRKFKYQCRNMYVLKLKEYNWEEQRSRNATVVPRSLKLHGWEGVQLTQESRPPRRNSVL
jgi:hypothetical protein